MRTPVQSGGLASRSGIPKAIPSTWMARAKRSHFQNLGSQPGFRWRSVARAKIPATVQAIDATSNPTEAVDASMNATRKRRLYPAGRPPSPVARGPLQDLTTATSRAPATPETRTSTGAATSGSGHLEGGGARAYQGGTSARIRRCDSQPPGTSITTIATSRTR